MPTYRIRAYDDLDEPGWLRCRLLAFFGSQYYDDVKVERTRFESPAVRLVAVDGDEVVGLIDVEVEGVAATIDSVATHPDHGRRGIASALLDAALSLAADLGAETIDAWTREDVAANGWYRRHGFVENYRYLHVHPVDDENVGFGSSPPLSRPVHAFAHASIEDEAAVRARYARVYVCRQYLRDLGAANQG